MHLMSLIHTYLNPFAYICLLVPPRLKYYIQSNYFPAISILPLNNKLAVLNKFSSGFISDMLDRNQCHCTIEYVCNFVTHRINYAISVYVYNTKLDVGNYYKNHQSILSKKV